jgi:hypothetical protein
VEAGSRKPDAPLPSLASDRPVGDELFIPSARSSSGVVSATADGAAWSPPELAGAGTSTLQASPAPPASPGPAAAPPVAPPARPEWVLEFDDGSRVVAGASGLMGRGPAPAPDEQCDQLLPLVDDTMRISKTHAAYGVDDRGFWVVDRASKNGVLVTSTNGATRAVPPGQRTPVPAGARVTLGGRSFTVTHGPGGQA